MPVTYEKIAHSITLSALGLEISSEKDTKKHNSIVTHVTDITHILCHPLSVFGTTRIFMAHPIDAAQYLTTRVNKNILSIKIFVKSQKSIFKHLLFVLQFQQNVYVAKICSFLRLLISMIFSPFKIC